MILGLETGVWFGIVSTTVSLGYAFYLHSVQNSIRLTPLIQHVTPLLKGIPRDVRASLRVMHRERPVDDLTLCEFEVRNTGQQPIQDVRRPLELRLPSGTEVLDVQIVQVYPPGRSVTPEVSVTDGRPTVRFSFFVLNKQEGFAAKALVRGELKMEDLEFHIESAGLPELLPQAEAMPETPLPKVRSNTLAGFGFFLAGASVLLYSLVVQDARLPWPFSITVWIEALTGLIVIVVTVLGAIVAMIAGLFSVVIHLPAWIARRRHGADQV